MGDSRVPSDPVLLFLLPGPLTTANRPSRGKMRCRCMLSVTRAPSLMNTPPARQPSTRLHIVTFPADTEEPSCDGSYTCACSRCIGERQARVDRGVRYQRRDPWLPRRARRAA